MLKIKVLLLLLLANIFQMQAQSGAGNSLIELPKVIPPSPTAASLGKYGEIPVSLYTGIPDISVPIWEIKEGALSMPISLSYHSSGIRVEDAASWVGLGWALNAGGVITRFVRGRPDETGYFNPSNPKLPNLLVDQTAIPASQCSILDIAKYCQHIADGDGYYDSEPDFYFFNFNGVQGKFVFDQDGNPHTVPYQKINIERNKSEKNKLFKWIITLSDGTKYKFNESEITTSYSAVWVYDNTMHLQEHDENRRLINQGFESSWYLTEIESPTGRKINLSYVDDNSESSSGVSERRAYRTANSQPLPQSQTLTGAITQVYGKRLQKISFTNGSVAFAANENRQDMGYFQGDSSRALSKIIIKNTLGKPIRNFLLSTSYFSNSGSNVPYFNKRLKLDSLREFSGDMSLRKPAHKFVYDETHNLPIRESTSQDHWGYYNGKTNRDKNGVPTLIPSFREARNIHLSYVCSNPNADPSAPDCYSGLTSVDYNVNTPVLFEFLGANRAINTEYGKSGILTKIIYPTGGYAIFEYEQNDYELQNPIKVTADAETYMAGSNCDVPTFNDSPIIPSTEGGVESCYQSVIFTPIDKIPSSQRAFNPTVSFDISLTAEMNGLTYRCCEDCYEPTGYIKDLTTNTVLVSFGGATGIHGGVGGIYTTNTNNPFPGYNPYWRFENAQLDPTHTYEFFSRTRKCDACPSQEEGCTGVVPRLGAYIVGRMSYKMDSVAEYNGLVGGLRIKKIIANSNLPNVPSVVKKYVYRLNNNIGRISSGVLMDSPIYFESISQQSNKIEVGSIVTYTTGNDADQAVLLTSGSKYELGQTNGSYVGYREVQEVICNDEDCKTASIGKVVYKYLSALDYQDVNSGAMGIISYRTDLPGNCVAAQLTKAPALNPLQNYYPYAPKNSYDWKRGLLSQKSIFDNKNNLRQLTTLSYNSIGGVNSEIISGLRISHDPLWQKSNDVISGPTLMMSTRTNYNYARYDILVDWNYLSKEKVITYDDNGKAFENTTEYFYDNPTHAQVTQMVKYTEGGKKVTERTTYPADYKTSQADVAVNLLKGRKYMHASPVEKTTILDNKGDLTILNDQVLRYKPWRGAAGDTLVLPTETVALELTRPLQYRPNNPSNEFPTYLPADGYRAAYWNGKLQRKAAYRYDASGNIVQVTPERGKSTVYLWGYYNTYPVAEIKNATYAQVVALVGNVATGTIELGGSGLTAAQEALVRAQLPGALITTYQYEPLVGKTLQTGPDGRATSYEYDGLGQLLRTRDERGRILSQHRYHYAGGQ